MNDSIINGYSIEESKNKNSLDSSVVLICDKVMKNDIDNIHFDKILLEEELEKNGKKLSDSLTLEEIAELIDRMNNVM